MVPLWLLFTNLGICWYLAQVFQRFSFLPDVGKGSRSLAYWLGILFAGVGGLMMGIIGQRAIDAVREVLHP